MYVLFVRRCFVQIQARKLLVYKKVDRECGRAVANVVVMS